MKHSKRIALLTAALLVVGATSATAMAASLQGTPAEIVAGLTGKTVESVAAEKAESGQTYGALADDYGVLDQFRSQMLEQKRAYLAERVAAGTMTQEQADAILAAMEAHQASCDGSGSGGVGAQMGAAFGGGNGTRGAGARNGMNRGSGICTDSAQS